MCSCGGMPSVTTSSGGMSATCVVCEATNGFSNLVVISASPQPIPQPLGATSIVWPPPPACHAQDDTGNVPGATLPATAQRGAPPARLSQPPGRARQPRPECAHRDQADEDHHEDQRERPADRGEQEVGEAALWTPTGTSHQDGQLARGSRSESDVRRALPLRKAGTRPSPTPGNPRPSPPERALRMAVGAGTTQR